MRSNENEAVVRKNVTQEAAAARSGQQGSVAVAEDIVAPTSEAAAGATPANVRSV